MEDLVTQLLDHGRRVGNIQHRGLSPRSVNLMLTLLGKVLEDEVKQGTLSRNVAKLVKHPHQVKKDMKTWTAEQAATFLETAADHRLSAAFQLSSTACVVVRSLACAGRMLIFRPRRSRSAEHESRSLVSGSWRGSLRPSAAVAPCRWMTAWWPLYVP